LNISYLEYYSDVQEEHGKEGHDGSKGYIEVSLIHSNVRLRSPERCSHIIRKFLLPNKYSIKKSWNIDPNTNNCDWGNVEPGLSCLSWKLEGEANTKESFYGDCQGHEDTSTHPNVCKRVNQERKKNNEENVAGIKCPVSIVDTTKDNKESIKAGEGK